MLTKHFFHHPAMVGVCGQFQLQNAQESHPIRLSEEPRPFFLWVCPLYFAPLRDWAVIACLRIITREDSRRSSAPQSAALRRAPQPQRSATEEWRAGGRRERNVGREERRKRETDWVVIKGLFFLPTGEHLHSSHLLRGDWATVHVCSHSHVQLAPFFERLASAASPFPHVDPWQYPRKCAGLIQWEDGSQSRQQVCQTEGGN